MAKTAKPKTVVTSVRIPAPLMRQVDALCASECRSRANMLQVIVERYVQRKEREDATEK